MSLEDSLFLIRSQFSSKIRELPFISSKGKEVPFSWDSGWSSPSIWSATLCYRPLAFEDYKRIKETSFVKQCHYTCNLPFGFKILEKEFN